MKEATDIALINGCATNSRKHQEGLYRKYFQKMFGFCIRHTRDETIAMSVVNDGFLKIFKYIDKYEHKGTFEAWMRRIMYNTVCDHYRKKQNKQKFSEVQDKGIEPSIYNELDYEDILLLVDNLTPATKKVFVLYAIDGYKHHEVAKQLDISESTSKWHLANAREKLQLMLKTQQTKLRII